MSWLSDRLNEPSTHAGIAVVGSQLLPLLLPQLGISEEVAKIVTIGFSAFFGTTAAAKSDTTPNS